VFDAPKPATKNTLVVEKATKESLTAVIRHKTISEGYPFTESLSHQVTGGTRVDKRSEILLRNAGLLPPGMQTVPGKGARLDAFGNMSRGQIVQILSYFKTFGSIQSSGRKVRGQKSRSGSLNRTKDYVRGIGFFVVPTFDSKRRLTPGIWRVDKSGIDLIIRFVPAKSMNYKARYPFQVIANKVGRANYEKEFDKAFRQAIATAR